MGSAIGTDYPILFDVNLNVSHAQTILTILEDGEYLDHLTSSATISVVLLNIESQSLTLMKVTAESTAHGSIKFHHHLTFVDPSPLRRLMI